MDFFSRYIRVKNKSGKNIQAIYNFADDELRPLIIIPCQFEATMKDNLTVSMLLVGNGFNVVRFDYTNHAGASDGNHIDFTLSGAYSDFDDIIKYVKSNIAYSDLGVLGISLTVRVLIKYFADNVSTDVKLFISLVGVINLNKTLHSVLNEDVIQGKQQGKIYGKKKVVKHIIDIDNYLDDAVINNYIGKSYTKKELNNLKTNMIVIFADNDEWVDLSDYYDVFGLEYEYIKEKIIIKDASHKLSKNPKAAETAFQFVVKNFSKYLKYKQMGDEEIYKPSKNEITEIIKLERKMEIELCS